MPLLEAVALTTHLIMPQAPESDAFLVDVAARLKEEFHIDHATIQVERGDSDATCHQSEDCAR